MVRTLLHGHRYDGSRAERELGLRYTDPRETVARTVDWARRRGPAARLSAWARPPGPGSERPRKEGPVSTGLVIVIVAVALLLLARPCFVAPRARGRSRGRDLEGRRGEVADAHRERAETRMTRAQEAEQIATRERAEAVLRETRARLHERGLADADLDADGDRVVEGDGSAVGGGAASSATPARAAAAKPAHGLTANAAGDFERGRAVGGRGGRGRRTGRPRQPRRPRPEPMPLS